MQSELSLRYIRHRAHGPEKECVLSWGAFVACHTPVSALISCHLSTVKFQIKSIKCPDNTTLKK